MNQDDHTPPEAPRRLEWPDEDEAPCETPEELRRLQAQFRAKVGPAIFDTRRVDYTQHLVWD